MARIGSFLVAAYTERLSAREGTLEHFLIERYTLFTARRRGIVHHAPYLLQKFDAERSTPEPCEWYGVGTPLGELVSALYSPHFSAGVAARRTVRR
jgi:hypothetical protein